MKNRDRVIKLIEELRSQPKGEERVDQFRSLLEQLNSASSNKFNRNPVIWSITLFCMLPLLMMKTSIKPSWISGVPMLLVYCWLISALFVIAWVWTRLPRHLNLYEVHVYETCHACQYDLNGHPSVLGDDVWVGPEVCPECGERYPAIG